MNKTIRQDQTLGSDTKNKKKIAKAKKNFDQLYKEIAPFVKTTKSMKITTAGKWQITDTVASSSHIS